MCVCLWKQYNTLIHNDYKNQKTEYYAITLSISQLILERYLKEFLSLDGGFAPAEKMILLCFQLELHVATCN